MGHKYHFEVKTGDEFLAGTDSNIFLILYGETGQLDEVRLNEHISGNAFERNKLDKFEITLNDDVGRIYKIDLRSDCKYAGSDWLLSYIEIKRDKKDKDDDIEINQTSKFIVNEWIVNKEKHPYEVDYSVWSSNIDRYETVEAPYESYSFKVAPNSTYEFFKTVKTTTGFKYSNIKTKKTTKNFNQEIGGSASYTELNKQTPNLEATKSFSAYLKFAFSQGFEDSEINEIIRTEDHEVTETTKATISNKTTVEEEYRAIFKLIKVNAIAKSGDIISLFSGNSKIVFAGFEKKTKLGNYEKASPFQ